MRIRPEAPGDGDAIHRLTQAAFAPMPYADGTEADIIRRLRDSGDLLLSLVAEEDGGIVGHVAFSPVTIDRAHDGWFGLGPISVRADRQRQGIGSKLVAEGLAALEARGARGCALVGNPEVYTSMGFASDGALRFRDVDPRFVQRIVLRGPAPRGDLMFASAFDPEVAAD